MLHTSFLVFVFLLHFIWGGVCFFLLPLCCISGRRYGLSKGVCFWRWSFVGLVFVVCGPRVVISALYISILVLGFLWSRVLFDFFKVVFFFLFFFSFGVVLVCGLWVFATICVSLFFHFLGTLIFILDLDQGRSFDLVKEYDFLFWNRVWLECVIYRTELSGF